jgi:hypothetical protein
MSLVNSLKNFFAASSCGCKATTKKNKNKNNKRRSTRKKYRGGYKSTSIKNEVAVYRSKNPNTIKKKTPSSKK